jgi:hypothetical protein
MIEKEVSIQQALEQLNATLQEQRAYEDRIFRQQILA